MREDGDKRYIANQVAVTQVGDFKISGTAESGKVVTAGSVFSGSLVSADRQTNGVTGGMAGGGPVLSIRSNAAATNIKTWDWFVGSNAIMYRLLSDDLNTATEYIRVVGSAGNIDSIKVPKLHILGNLKVDGTATVADDAYNATTWNGSFEVPTKNAIRDKIESLGVGITSINSQTGPAITLTGGIGTYTSAPSSNTIAYNVDPTSDIFTRTIDAIITTAGNSGAGETDLYSKSIAGGTLNTDKQTLNIEIDGEVNDNTATAQLKLYFAGNVTLNTGAIAISTANTAWKVRAYIIRTSSTTAHVTYELDGLGLATPKFLGYSNLTSLDFTTSNILKVTAQAGGAGGGSSDITAHSWQITYKPQP